MKNRFYAWMLPDGKRGIASSWVGCEAIVSGRKARFRGFPDRRSAERWLAGEAVPAPSAGPSRLPGKVYGWRTEDREGIASSWDECERMVMGRSARCRAFPDREAASRWLAAGAPYEDREAARKEALRACPADSLFFDSGTGPGRGVEIRVTTMEGAPVIHLGKPAEGRLTEEGNLLLGRGRTNNYGELMACLLALRAAGAMGSLHVYGDSKLVLDYWSLGRVSRSKREDDPDLARLAGETASERRRFEAAGGILGHVSGGANPADLGFHRD